jgi:protein TonB
MDPGTYTVQVRFLVERDGSITDVQALSDPGFGLKKAAEDVIKK